MGESTQLFGFKGVRSCLIAGRVPFGVFIHAIIGAGIAVILALGGCAADNGKAAGESRASEATPSAGGLDDDASDTPSEGDLSLDDDVQYGAAQSEAAQPEESQSEFMRNVESGAYRSIRLVGDSITAGYGADGFEDPDVLGTGAIIYDDGMGEVHHEPSVSINSWANAFRRWADSHGVESFLNAGISGWFMTQLAENPDAWLGEGADVIVVALGTNDAGYVGPDEFREASVRALEAAQQRSKLVVVLSPVADLRPQEWLVEPATELGEILSQICSERGYVFVDTRDEVLPSMFCDDGLHPRTEGSLAIWECVKARLGLVD